MSSRPTMNKWLLFLAFAPILIAMTVHARGVTESPLPASVKLPALVFEQYFAERRNLTAKEHRPWVYYAFVNSSAKPVRLDSITVPECNCVQIKLFNAHHGRKTVHQLAKEDEVKNFAGFSIKPGEAYYVLAYMDSTNKQPGWHKYKLRVSYEDTEPRLTTLQCNFNLPEKKIVVDPEVVAIIQTQPKVKKTSAWVTDYRGNDLKIKSAKSKSKYVTVEVGESQIDQVKKTEIIISTTERIPDGREKTEVILETDDPDFPELKIPVFVDGIRGRIRPLKLDRDHVYFAIPTDATKPVLQNVVLTSAPKSDLKITKIKSSVDYLSVTQEETSLNDNQETQFPLSISVKPFAKPGTYRESLELHTTDPDWPTIPVHVKIEIYEPESGTASAEALQ